MIIITGASDGLGQAIAKLYKENGLKVVNISRRDCEYADVNIKADLTKGEDISRAAAEVCRLEHELSALINCVGVWGEEAIGDMTESETDRILATNVKAPMMFISSLMTRIRRDGADIVNVISTAALHGNPHHAAYAASKWGERGFTEVLRAELKTTSSRVIGFYPGGMKTEFFKKDKGLDTTQDGSYWMSAHDVAVCLKQLLDLPKNIEVSEITLNRKKLA